MKSNTDTQVFQNILNCISHNNTISWRGSVLSRSIGILSDHFEFVVVLECFNAKQKFNLLLIVP